MRTFMLNNVVKKTDSDVRARKYLASGFSEVDADGRVIGSKKTDDVKELQIELSAANTKIAELETAAKPAAKRTTATKAKEEPKGE